MGGLEDQNPAFLHERAQPRRLPVYNAYMKPVGYIKNYKQTFHLTHNGSIRGECWPLPFAQIWPQTKGKKKHPSNISVQCKCSWRQRQETRTWLINMSTRSNGVKLQSGAISVPPCPTRVPMRRCRHDESEARHCPPRPPTELHRLVKVNRLLGWQTQYITFSVSRVLLSKMKEIQVRTTSSRRALLKTEPLFPVMDTEAGESERTEEVSVA